MPPTSLAQLFRMNPNLFPGVDPGAFNTEINEALPESIEKQRENNTLSAMDNRAEQGIQRDLTEAGQVHQARDLGFQGSYPLRELQDYLFKQQMQKELLPVQMKGEYDVMGAQAQAEAAMARDRVKNQDIVERQGNTQAEIRSRMRENQMRADAMRRAAAMEREGGTPLPSRSWGAALSDLLSGRTEGARRREEAERIRQSIPPAVPNTPNLPDATTDPEFLEGDEGWQTLPNGMRFRQR